MTDDPFAQKVRVNIPRIGTVLFPPDLDPITVDQEARKLYMKANAGRLPMQQPQPQMGPPTPLPDRYMSRAPEPTRDRSPLHLPHPRRE